MIINLQKERFKRLIKKNVIPFIALSKEDGLTIQEVEDKLLELFDMAEKHSGGEDMEDIFHWVNFVFDGWLEIEKGLDTSRAHEISQHLYGIFGELIQEKIGKKVNFITPKKFVEILGLQSLDTVNDI